MSAIIVTNTQQIQFIRGIERPQWPQTLPHHEMHTKNMQYKPCNVRIKNIDKIKEQKDEKKHLHVGENS